MRRIAESCILVTLDDTVGPYPYPKGMLMNGLQLSAVGNLTRDPETQSLASGATLTKFSIAVERSWRTESGEWDKATSYLDVVCWRYLAEDAARLLEKGVRVVVSGRLDQVTWEDKDTGAKRSRFELTADEIALHLKNIESFERRRYDENAPKAAASRPQARPASPQGGDDIWS